MQAEEGVTAVRSLGLQRSGHPTSCSCTHPEWQGYIPGAWTMLGAGAVLPNMREAGTVSKMDEHEVTYSFHFKLFIHFIVSSIFVGRELETSLPSMCQAPG